MDGTSDQAASNWGNVYTPGDPNNVPLARSNFDPGHRVTLTATYDMPFARVVRPVVSVFYSGSSGRPYTLTYNNDANGDNRFTNDLVYIPTATDHADLYGRHLQRPARVRQRRPVPGGVHRPDHSAQRLPRAVAEHAGRPLRDPAAVQALQGGDHARRAQPAEHARLRRAACSSSSRSDRTRASATVPTTVTATAPLTGYNITSLTASNFTRFLRDDIRSRWQIQLGARVRF